MIHCFFFGSDSDNHVAKTKNAYCDLKVNRFQKWFQAFWKVLNQNSAFSRSINIHHFSTSLQRNVVSWGLRYANIFVDFFPTLMINILKRFVLASKVTMCNWSFFRQYHVKKVCCQYDCHDFFFFSTWYNDCEKTKKLIVHPSCLKKANISVDLFFFSLPKTNFHYLLQNDCVRCFGTAQMQINLNKFKRDEWRQMNGMLIPF